MFGLILIVVAYVLLGFVLAWIANIVAREDIEVKTGVLILFLTAVGSVAGAFTMRALGAPDGVRSLAGAGINFGLLIVLLHAIARLSWKHSAIIAAVYTAVLFAISFAIGACASAP